MSLKFKILHELNGDVITSPLKGWWRNNRGESQKISHEMYFHLLKEGWQTEVIGNEVILYEPNSLNGVDIPVQSRPPIPAESSPVIPAERRPL